MNLPITCVTANAAQDAPDDFYMAGLLDLWRNGTAEVPGPLDYPRLLSILGEPLSRKAWWQHRVTGNRVTFPPDARNRLRQAIDNMPPVAPPVTTVTTERIDPNAGMYWVGPDITEKSRLVLMIAPNLTHIEISVNGTISARTVAEAQGTPVTPVTLPHSDNRKPAYRPRLSLELKARIEASGRTIEELIEAGLSA